MKNAALLTKSCSVLEEVKLKIAGKYLAGEEAVITSSTATAEEEEEEDKETAEESAVVEPTTPATAVVALPSPSLVAAGEKVGDKEAASVDADDADDPDEGVEIPCGSCVKVINSAQYRTCFLKVCCKSHTGTYIATTVVVSRSGWK